mgnify:CR=1 FL=1
MAEPRRRRAATEEKLTRVLDAAEQLMLDEGYAAVTSRNVAARAGNRSTWVTRSPLAAGPVLPWRISRLRGATTFSECASGV